MERIDILLATFNGGTYLGEQLESIAAQTHENWRVIARDDGSSDDTLAVLEAFRARCPDKVTVLDDELGNLGLQRNFSRLMEHSDAPYAAFCDQDDVWSPEKLELCLVRMRELEIEHGRESPLLVFTDLEVVDETLQVIDTSFWRSANLRPDRCNSLNRLLFQNVVTGCTTLMNRLLVKKAIPVPAAADLHDWWVALVAASCGRAGYITRPTVRYRQHGRNIVGARSLALGALPKLVRQFFGGYRAHRTKVRNRFVQGRAFLERYGASLSEQQCRTLEDFLRIPDGTLVQRLMQISSLGMSPTGLWRFCLYALWSGRGRGRDVAAEPI